MFIIKDIKLNYTNKNNKNNKKDETMYVCI